MVDSDSLSLASMAALTAPSGCRRGKAEQVEQTLRMADLYGFELGDFKLNEEAHPFKLLNGAGHGTREEVP